LITSLFSSVTDPFSFPSPQPVIQVFVYRGRSHKHKAQHLERSDMDSNQASEQVQFGEGIFISKFRDRVNNNHGNREFEMLLKLFVKDLNPRNLKSAGVI
jgi:hypothetical protein